MVATENYNNKQTSCHLASDSPPSLRIIYHYLTVDIRKYVYPPLHQRNESY